MNIKDIIVLLTLSILTASCSSAELPAATEAPAPTQVPTEAPTEEPQPTAKIERVESGFYRRTDAGWTPIYEDEMTSPVFLPEELTGGDLDFFQMVQYGYFSDYQADLSVLSAYVEVPPGGLFRMLDFAVSSDQIVNCLPQTIGDDTPIGGIKIMPVNGSVNFPSGPGNKSISDLLPAINDYTYVVLVLRAAVNADAVNPLNQLAMLCPQ